MYCPTGSVEPLSVGIGNYSVGPPGARSGQTLCPLGQYCDGTGVPLDCPAGYFGGTQGLTNASCSGRCADGALCEPRSVSPTSVPCPAGSVCLKGVAFPCPRGTYNPVMGASKASASCLGCPAEFFGNTTGATSIAACTPCGPRESSGVGAAVCWPGLSGMVFLCVLLLLLSP